MRLGNLQHIQLMSCILPWFKAPQWARASSLLSLHDPSQTQKSVLLWTSDQLDTDLCLTTHNNHKRQKSKPPAEFEATITASERPQTYAIGSATPGIAHMVLFVQQNRTLCFGSDMPQTTQMQKMPLPLRKPCKKKFFQIGHLGNFRCQQDGIQLCIRMQVVEIGKK